MKLGYSAIEIRSPKDIIGYEDEQQIKEKEFDTVKTFREIKEKISKDIYGMTLPQIQEYLRQQKLKASSK